MFKNVDKQSFFAAYKSIQPQYTMNQQQLEQFTNQLVDQYISLSFSRITNLIRMSQNKSGIECKRIVIIFQHLINLYRSILKPKPNQSQSNRRLLDGYKEKANKMLEDLRIQLKEIENLYEEAQDQNSVEGKTNRVSKFYKQELSAKPQGKIQLTIEEVVGINSRQQGQQYIVNVSFDNQSFQTRPSSLLKYNQTFNMYHYKQQEYRQVNNPNKQIIISLMPESRFQQSIEGSISLNLNQYKDQNMHYEQLNLQDKQGRVMDQRLIFNIQWIFSPTDFYEKRINEWQLRIGEEENIIQELSTDLNNLYSILRGLDQKEPKKIVFLESSAVSPLKKWHSRTQTMIFVFIAFSAIISFERTNYFDISLIFAITYDFTCQSLDGQKMMIYLIGLLISVIQDLVWLLLNNFEQFVEGTQQFDNNSESIVKGAIYIFVVGMLLVKLVFGLFFNELYKEIDM